MLRLIVYEESNPSGPIEVDRLEVDPNFFDPIELVAWLRRMARPDTYIVVEEV